MSLKAGIIGAGSMGRNHLRVLKNLKDVEFVGICDSTFEENSIKDGYKVTKWIADLLEEKPDYVIVAVPTIKHLEVAETLADKGVHALIEKPLAHDLDACLQIEKRFRESNLIGAVGHIERFNPAVREAKKRISQLGQIFQISTRREGPFSGRISDVGVVKDLASHDIDLVEWLTNSNYKSIYAQLHKVTRGSNEDMLLATGSLDSGIKVSHIVNWISPRKMRSVSILGEKGAFEIDTLNGDLTFYENGKLTSNWDNLAYFKGVSEGNIIKYSFEKKEPLLCEHENFRNNLLQGDGDIVSMADGVRVLRVAEAMLQSAFQDKSIEVID